MSTAVRTGWPRGSEYLDSVRRKLEHEQRCRTLPPLKPGEAEQLVAAFAAKRGGFTKCPAAYLVPIQQ